MSHVLRLGLQGSGIRGQKLGVGGYFCGLGVKFGVGVQVHVVPLYPF
jgi:hypothetical protein